MSKAKILGIVLLALGGLVFLLAKLVSRLNLGLSTVNHLDATEAPAAMILAAFESEAVYDPEFFFSDPKSSAEERELILRHHSQLLPSLKSGLKPDAKVQLLHGIQFNGSPSTVSAYPMKHESTKSPSTFQLPPGARKQAYMVLSAPGANTDRYYIHVLAWRVDGSWKPVTISGHPGQAGEWTAEKLIRRAIEEERNGDPLLALASCQLASFLAPVVPHRVSGAQAQIRGMEERLSKYFEAQGPPLASVEVGGLDVEIMNVGARVVSGDCLVEIATLVDEIAAPEVMDERQKELAAAFHAKYPQFETDFHGILISQLVGPVNAKSPGYRSFYIFED